jgi:hypothetical protein
MLGKKRLWGPERTFFPINLFLEFFHGTGSVGLDRDSLARQGPDKHVHSDLLPVALNSRGTGTCSPDNKEQPLD